MWEDWCSNVPLTIWLNIKQGNIPVNSSSLSYYKTQLTKTCWLEIDFNFKILFTCLDTFMYVVSWSEEFVRRHMKNSYVQKGSQQPYEAI